MAGTPPVDLSTYDPMAREIQQDPFPYYAALRAKSPVHRLRDSNVYCISRMSTLRAVLADTATFSSRASNAATQVPERSSASEPPPPETRTGPSL